MKRALIQLLVIPLITILGIIVNAVFPPYSGVGQQLPPDKRIVEDSTMTIDEAKEIIKTAESNADIVKGMEVANKTNQPGQSEQKTKTQIRTITKYVPVIKTKVQIVYRDSVFVSNGRGVEKPIIIYKAPPVYSSGEIKYLTFSEWRQQTGEKSEKKYKKYLKDLGVIK